MKKFISLISAAVFSATLVLPQTLAFSAAAEESALEESTVFDAAAAEANPFQATGTANTLPYQLRFVPERNFVTAEEVAAGDVVIPAAVYISGSTANRFGSVMVKYDAFRNDEKTDSVYFSGISTGDNAHRTSEKKTYNSSQGTFTTDYVPYCFGSVYDDEYDSNSPMFTTREYACDPIFGSTITSAGKNKIKFNASFYNSADERKNGVKKTNKDFIADVTVDENGNGVYSYDYIDQSSFQTITKTATLPRYNPDTPEGEKLPDTCNSVMWVAGTSQLKDGAEFLGSTSDEFPLFHVNIVISKGTASGIYDVQFLTRETVGANEAPTQLTSNKSKEFPTELVGTSIAVGVDSVAVTDSQQDNVQFYTDSNTNIIRATDFASKILADVTYTDGTTESDVDITNYVMLEYGQPMHAFDQRYVKDGKIVVRNAKDGETITTLDGQERQLSPEMLIIADAEKPIAVAGVMGGEYSGIMDDTNTVIFESAYFEPVQVRRTAKKLGMRTDASARYEKGLDPDGCPRTLKRAMELVELLGAGEPVAEFIEVDNRTAEPVQIPFDPDWINRFLGTEISREDMVKTLEALEIHVDGDVCISPSFRIDLERPADIAEEVARIYGYNNIPSTVIRGVAEAQLTPQQHILLS